MLPPHGVWVAEATCKRKFLDNNKTVFADGVSRGCPPQTVVCGWLRAQALRGSLHTNANVGESAYGASP